MDSAIGSCIVDELIEAHDGSTAARGRPGADYKALRCAHLNRERVRSEIEKDRKLIARADIEKELLSSATPMGLERPRHYRQHYPSAMLKCAHDAGFCPSAGGARAPISSIITYVDRNISQGSVFWNGIIAFMVFRQLHRFKIAISLSGNHLKRANLRLAPLLHDGDFPQ